MVVLIATIASIVAYLWLIKHEEEDLHTKADDYLSYLKGTVEIPIWNYDEDAIRQIGQYVAQNELIRKLVIRDASGRVLFSLEKNLGAETIHRRGDVVHKGEFIGEVEFLFTKEVLKAHGRSLLFYFAIGTLLILASLAVVTGFLIRSFLKNPLNSLNEIVDAYAAGEYDATDIKLTYYEFEPFGKVLGQMGQAIKKHQTQLEELVDERTTQLLEAKEQAEAANQSKSEFLARMSHEIRTPLNAVTGLTNIVLKSELTSEQRDYLNKVQIASNNLLEVINDILDFSKVEAGRLELTDAPFDLDQVLEELADLFSHRVAQKDIELVFTPAQQVPRQLTGDAGRLTQVLTNLVENAVKFTETGEITVGVENDDQIEKQTGKAAIRFHVSDSGIGIPTDVLPYLFDPFIQAEGYLTRKHEGSGLGLAISKRLVELMGGRIWAESTPGKGSTFSFTVVMETQGEKPLCSPLVLDLRGLRTLVVDDSASARQVLVDQLESCKFEVAAVDSGAKAIKAVQQADLDKPFQVVLLDWKMPDMDGMETARRIRALGYQEPQTTNPNPQTPIIVMVTAYGHELLREHIDKDSVDALLLKPIKSSDLFNTLMDLFGQAEAGVPIRQNLSAANLVLRLPDRRVLVAEDSELNRDVATALLEEAGLTVEVAENGKIAVDKVTEASEGYYAAVLMDVQMPVMDGYEATRRIRQWEADAQFADHRIPVIAVTAHALKGEKEKCLAADMDDYLAKPLDEQDLHRVLSKWITPKEEDKSASDRV